MREVVFIFFYSFFLCYEAWFSLNIYIWFCLSKLLVLENSSCFLFPPYWWLYNDTTYHITEQYWLVVAHFIWKMEDKEGSLNFHVNVLYVNSLSNYIQIHHVYLYHILHVVLFIRSDSFNYSWNCKPCFALAW